MSPKPQLILAGVLGLVSLSVWFAFLRPAPAKSIVGVITEKQFKAAGVYWQQPIGQRSGFYGPTQIPVAECYVFAIQVEGWPDPAHLSLNTVAAQEFEVGQKVRIEYQMRSFPLIWKRVTVLKMTALQAD